VVGTIGLLMLGAIVVWMLSAGMFAASIFAALVLLYQIWNTYDTFVVKECWTLYLKVIE
jgi:hypothetical protein